MITGAKRMNRALIPPSRQDQREQAAGEAEGLALAAVLEQLGEHGHERGRDGGVREQGPDQVRDLEGDGEGREASLRAEVARGEDLARQARDARQPGGDREDC